jgi:hypothetical protein
VDLTDWWPCANCQTLNRRHLKTCSNCGGKRGGQPAVTADVVLGPIVDEELPKPPASPTAPIRAPEPDPGMRRMGKRPDPTPPGAAPIVGAPPAVPVQAEASNAVPIPVTRAGEDPAVASQPPASRTWRRGPVAWVVSGILVILPIGMLLAVAGQR